MAGICNKLFNLAAVNFFPRLEKVHKTCIQVRTRVKNTPRLKFPLWYLKKERTLYPEKLTSENEEFVKEVVHDTFGSPVVVSGIPTFKPTSPLRNPPIEKGEWKIGSRRCGLISRKIGCYPMWDNNGKIMWTTLLQVIDNHVVKYTPPEEVESPRKVKRFCRPNKFGILLVGAESGDPQKYTKEYCGLFSSAGLPPKKFLGKFRITTNAIIQPGTPLSACHFQPGEVVDVCGKTVDRGFQGVMKRWGFKGMPASHGVTKTHRRGGNIGGGGAKGRVWPGTKMPGHMGNKWRVHRGLKVWRINTKYNVIYVQGLGVPGETNSIIYIHDTLLPLRKHKESPLCFPTYYPETENPLPDDLYESKVHPFDQPSITFDVTKA